MLSYVYVFPRNNNYLSSRAILFQPIMFKESSIKTLKFLIVECKVEICVNLK